MINDLLEILKSVLDTETLFLGPPPRAFFQIDKYYSSRLKLSLICISFDKYYSNIRYSNQSCTKHFLETLPKIAYIGLHITFFTSNIFECCLDCFYKKTWHGCKKLTTLADTRVMTLL